MSRSTDDIFATLEDNQVKISTMKASRFVKPFEADVDRWERTLSHILEVTEMLLTVQRQWMYLEVRYYFYSLLKELIVTSLFSIDSLILFVSMLYWVRVYDSNSEFTVVSILLTVEHFPRRRYQKAAARGVDQVWHCQRQLESYHDETVQDEECFTRCPPTGLASDWLIHLHLWLIIMIGRLVEMLAECYRNQMLCYVMKACWSSWTQWTATWRPFRSLSTCIWKLRGKYSPASTSSPTTICSRFSDSRRIPSRCSLTSRNVSTTSRILPWAR